MNKMLVLRVLNFLEDVKKADISDQLRMEACDIFDAIVEQEELQLQFSPDFGWGIFLPRKEEKDARQ